MTVDLRSDTVTLPTPEMRRAMADAAVGDDVYAEDPTARELEEHVASLLGKEAALFVPSGTMANQIALLLHCGRGDAVIVGEGTHTMFYESGAAAAWSGVQFSVIEGDGLFSSSQMEAAVNAPADWLPRTRLVVVENTHNRAGGRVFPQQELTAIGQRARALGLSLHLDGARLWNAAAATGLSLASLAEPADTVSVCFSKGLGAPVGSAIAGPGSLIREARRYRKMLGGGMRQIGILCAAALHAVRYHRERLLEDHALAKRLAQGVAELRGLSVELARVETNIVNIDVHGRAATELVARLHEQGVRLSATGPSRLRAVVHRDISRADIEHALGAFARAL